MSIGSPLSAKMNAKDGTMPRGPRECVGCVRGLTWYKVGAVEVAKWLKFDRLKLNLVSCGLAESTWRNQNWSNEI